MDEKKGSKFAYYAPLCLKFLALMLLWIAIQFVFQFLDGYTSDFGTERTLFRFLKLGVAIELFRRLWRYVFSAYILPFYVKAIFAILFLLVVLCSASYFESGTLFGFLEPRPPSIFDGNTYEERLEIYREFGWI